MNGMAGRRRVMAHMIPFFPNLETSRRVASALVDSGASYLEIQFPYSDPTADGPAIQGACAQALGNGFRVEDGWEFVRSVAQQSVPVFVMSYAGLVYAYGVQRFVAAAAESGAEGVIVPDLPVDSDEGLFAAAHDAGVHAVPVVVMGAAEERLRMVEALKPDYVYASLRRGITGTHTEIGAENTAFIRRLNHIGARVVAGFGISTPEQVTAVTEHAHAAVVGSAFVRAISAAYNDSRADPYDAVAELERSTGEWGSGRLTTQAGFRTVHVWNSKSPKTTFKNACSMQRFRSSSTSGPNGAHPVKWLSRC